jgi:hypothetical protein
MLSLWVVDLSTIASGRRPRTLILLTDGGEVSINRSE